MSTFDRKMFAWSVVNNELACLGQPEARWGEIRHFDLQPGCNPRVIAECITEDREFLGMQIAA